MDLSVRNIIKGDKVIWIVLLLLSLMSLLIIYSSTGALAYRKMGGETWYYLIRQIGFIAFGFGVILVMVHVVPVKIYSMFSQGLVYISIGLLIYTLVLKYTGHAGDKSGRTLDIGIISFQPAEFAKISLIMFTARILSKFQKDKEELFGAFKKIIIYTGIICLLIFFTEFSSAALLFITIMSMMFIGRIPFKYLGLILASGLVLVVLIYFTAELLPSDVAGKHTRMGTVKGRIERFISGDSDTNMGITQADYAKLAIYEGGFFGKGPGHSDVSNLMAAAYNDFIFAIIVEEYGLVIGGVLILLYLIFFFRSVIIIRRATRTFPAFLVAGLTLMLIFQAMVNIGVSAGVLPVTGQPLPWVSMGGTSMIFTSIAFGCIISVSYQNQKNRVLEEGQRPVQINTPDEDQAM
jgi:cell division protein FtsW